MRDFQGRRRWHRILRSEAFSFILLVLALILLNAVWGVYKKDSVARINLEEAQKTLDQLQKKKAGLEKQIARLDTERGVEGELRRRFQVVKPGEQVLVIVDKPESKLPLVEAPITATSYIWQSLVGMLSFWK